MYHKEYTDNLEYGLQKKEEEKEDNTDHIPCDSCDNRQICEDRQDTEGWIYSDQFALCCDLTHPEYHDVDWWVLRETMGNRECTPEELEKLHMELGIEEEEV